MIGNVFAKKKLFQKREAIDAKRFVEIYQNFDTSGKDNKSYLPLKDGSQKNLQVQLREKVFIQDLKRDIYGINLADFIPPRCTMGDSFEVVYDDKNKKLYAVPQDCGVIRLIIDGIPVEFKTSDLVPVKNKVLVGSIELEVGEYFRASSEEFI